MARKLDGCDECPLRMVECKNCLSEIVYVADGGRGAIPIAGARKAGQYSGNARRTVFVCAKCARDVFVDSERRE